MDNTLSLELRNDAGKGVARKLRADGKAPGVIYADGADATSIAFDTRTLTDIFRRTRNRNTVVQLQMGDKTVPAIVKAAQRHPVSREILHVDFYAVGDKPIEVMVPVRAVGRPAGASIGGRIRLIRRDLKVKCTYDKIPATLDVDVTPMHIGDFVAASEIPTADGVEILFENDFNVVSCYGKKGGKK